MFASVSAPVSAYCSWPRTFSRRQRSTADSSLLQPLFIQSAIDHRLQERIIVIRQIARLGRYPIKAGHVVSWLVRAMLNTASLKRSISELLLRFYSFLPSLDINKSIDFIDYYASWPSFIVIFDTCAVLYSFTFCSTEAVDYRLLLQYCSTILPSPSKPSSALILIGR
jgi:hypothetical protein